MTHTPPRLRTEILDIPLAEQWALHHVLLDRLDREEATVEDHSPFPPQLAEIYRAFETLDAGDCRFTVPQLEAILTLLAEYRCSSAWEHDHDRLEALHDELDSLLNGHRAALPTEQRHDP